MSNLNSKIRKGTERYGERLWNERITVTLINVKKSSVCKKLEFGALVHWYLKSEFRFFKAEIYISQKFGVLILRFYNFKLN